MTLKINGATGGSVSIDAPDNTSPAGTDVTLTLPTSAGSSGQYLQTNGSGTLSWQTVASDAISEGNTSVECVDTGSDGHITFDTEGSERARFTSNGRFLIGGSTTPRANFDNGSNTCYVQLEGSDGAASSLALIGNANATFFEQPRLILAKAQGSGLGNNGAMQNPSVIGDITFQGSDGTEFVEAARIRARVDNAPSANDMPTSLTFWTTANSASSPTERMRIDSDGYLKASRDGTYFNVNENNHSLENSWNGNLIARLYHGGTDGNQYGLEITTGHDQNNATNHFFQCVGGSTVRARFTSNGGLRNYQANDVNLCDEREKKNIVDLDSTWDCLKHWDLKKFHYNDQDDTEDKKYGVIAQQIAPHCPEVIDNWVKQEAKEAVLDDDGNVVTPAVEEITRMGVKEQQMMWMAIKALQEAQVRIEALETANASLETRLTALEGGAA